jgi:hypothetical protein
VMRRKVWQLRRKEEVASTSKGAKGARVEVEYEDDGALEERSRITTSW